MWYLSNPNCAANLGDFAAGPQATMVAQYNALTAAGIAVMLFDGVTPVAWNYTTEDGTGPKPLRV